MVCVVMGAIVYVSMGLVRVTVVGYDAQLSQTVTVVVQPYGTSGLAIPDQAAVV